MSRIGFPLLLIPLAVFNIMVFLMSGVSFDAPVMAVPLLSGTKWTVTVSDLLIAIAVLLLMFEIIRAARGKYLIEHLLSLLLLGGAAAEFLLLEPFGNSTFFFLALLTLVDFFAGLALRAKRPARAKAKPVVGTPVSEPYQPRVEPAPVPASMPTPAPAPAVPETPAASSSAPSPRAEPVIVPPVAAANDSAAPEVKPNPDPDAPAH